MTSKLSPVLSNYYSAFPTSFIDSDLANTGRSRVYNIGCKNIGKQTFYQWLNRSVSSCIVCYTFRFSFRLVVIAFRIRRIVREPLSNTGTGSPPVAVPVEIFHVWNACPGGRPTSVGQVYCASSRAFRPSLRIRVRSFRNYFRPLL